MGGSDFGYFAAALGTNSGSGIQGDSSGPVLRQLHGSSNNPPSTSNNGPAANGAASTGTTQTCSPTSTIDASQVTGATIQPGDSSQVKAYKNDLVQIANDNQKYLNDEKNGAPQQQVAQDVAQAKKDLDDAYTQYGNMSAADQTKLLDDIINGKTEILTGLTDNGATGGLAAETPAADAALHDPNYNTNNLINNANSERVVQAENNSPLTIHDPYHPPA